MLDAIKVIERRGKPRIETKVQARVVGEGGFVETFWGNLSKSGIFLETKEPFAKVGDRVQMYLSLKTGSEGIKVSGKVVRITKPNQLGNPSGMGIHFLRIEARQARTFDRLIDRLLDARGIGSRRFPRAKTQIVVELKGKDLARKAVTDNLSRGGIFLRMPIDGMILGDTLTVILEHPTAKRKFMVEAEIVHLRKGESTLSAEFVEGVGIQFLEKSATRVNDMALFLRSILSAQRRKSKS